MKKEKNDYAHHPSFLYDRSMREWWPALDAQKKIIQYKKGQRIFSEGEPVPGVYFLIEGVVKVHKRWVDDKELILRFAHKQDIIGHRGLSTISTVYPISATALSNLKLCFLNMDFFRATMKGNPGLLFDFMMFFADELQLSEQRMRDLAHMPVKNRLANALLTLEDKFGKNAGGYIDFQISRQDIASYVGAAYETVYKLLAEFNQAGLIRTDGKEIGLVDREKIRNV